MKRFEYIDKSYIPKTDLVTLGKTYDTLEQGHKDAVTAASDLKLAISALDMNEADDDFKQQLTNEIQENIDKHTVYGNSYGALDDLIASKGNIMSDSRVIGRLRNQAAKKEFDAKVDSMNITEGMKQMYKEENPYYYKDGEYDETTNKYKAGEKWKVNPNYNPVNTVGENVIQSYALQIAAKEAGGGSSVMFLDANGKPTSDPSKSEDGSIYKQVSGTWERLPESKIAQAYKVAIDSIPGAKDSLEQDYKYALWERDKLIKNTKDNSMYVSGITDKNGNIYTYDQWLNNKINKFTDVAAYNHVTSNVSYGTALQNRKARLAKAASRGLGDNFSDINSKFGANRLGYKVVEGNAFAGATNSKVAANNTALRLVKKLNPKVFKNCDSVTDVMIKLRKNKEVKGPNSAVNWLIKNYGNSLTPTEKVQLRNSFNGYVSSNQQVNKIVKKAGKNIDGLNFSLDIANNTFTNNNRYSKKIINKLNDIYKNNKSAKYKVGFKILQGVANSYNTNIKGLSKLGFNIIQTDDGNYEVEIDANHRNLLPRFAYTIKTVDEQIPGKLKGWLRNIFTKNVASSNYSSEFGYSILSSEDTGISGAASQNGLNILSTSEALAKLYEQGLDAGAKAEQKVGTNKGTITFSGTDSGSFAALFYRANAENLGYTEEQLRSKIKDSEAYVDRMFGTGQFDGGLIEEIDSSGKAVRNIKDAQDIKLLIQKMYSNNDWKKDVSRVTLIPTGGAAGQPKGYNISFVVPKDAATGKFEPGQKVNFNVYDTIEEERDYDASYDPSVLANNRLQISGATKSNIENLGYDNNLGNTDLKFNPNGTYNTTLMGVNKDLSSNEAEALTTMLINLQMMKSNYIGLLESNQLTEANAQQYEQAINNISNGISTIINKNPNDVNNNIINYFNSMEIW